MSRHSHARRVLSGCAAVAALIVHLPLAWSQARVRVVAETRIDVAAERAGASVQVLGVLRDDLGAALPHRELTVVTQLLADDGTAAASSDVAFGEQTLFTDERGEFSLVVPYLSGRFELSCHFAGDEFGRAASVQRTVDPGLADVRLQFDLAVTSRELDLDVPRALVRVRAESSEGAQGIALTLRDELGQAHASATADAAGVATFELGTGRDTPAGPGRWRVEFEGDEQRAPAQAELPILRVRDTALTATLDAQTAEAGETVTLGGTLSDARGGIATGTVGIFGDGEHVLTVVTDATGAYRASFEVPQQRANSTWMLEARFAPETPGPKPSTSPPVALAITSPWPIDWLWLLLPLCLSLVALIMARRSARLTTPAAPRAAIEVPGIRGSPRPQGTPRPDELAGVILDHQRGSTRSGAVITLARATGEAAQPEARTESDSEGRFAFRGLASGTYRLQVALPGYVTTEQRITIPHRGEWSAVVVRMESYRARALAVFRRVGRRLVESERVFETTTNREIPAVAPEAQRGPLLALAQLTDRLYYGAIDPAAEDLPPLEHAATAIEQHILPPRAPRDPND